MAAVGGFLIWQRYGPSDERADLEQYYELEEDNDLAVIIDNEVIRRSDAVSDTSDQAEAQNSPAPGKI